MPKFTRQKLASVPGAIKPKWTERILDEGFVPFPKRFLRCLAEVISDVRDLQVVLAIVDYRREMQTNSPSITFLAFTAGMPVDKFKNRLASLQNDGLIKVTGTEAALDVSLEGLFSKIIELTPEDS